MVIDRQVGVIAFRQREADEAVAVDDLSYLPFEAIRVRAHASTFNQNDLIDLWKGIIFSFPSHIERANYSMLSG